LVKTPAEVQSIAEKMCGKTLITKQSGDAGFPCNCVYIVEKIAIAKEFYLSLTLDRKAGMPVFIYSPAGGMSIEDVAHKNPEQIFRIHVNPATGPDVDDLIKAATNLGIPHLKSQLVFLMKNLYDCFIEKDCDMIEINPLVVTKSD
jgi:succinyl-CoA synthetase beta subunit